MGQNEQIVIRDESTEKEEWYFNDVKGRYSKPRGRRVSCCLVEDNKA